MAWRDHIRAKQSPEDAFAQEISAAIRKHLDVKGVEAAPDFSLAITFRDGKATTMYLGTIFREANTLTGKERQERLRRAVLAMAPSERPTTWRVTQGRLRPAIRATSWAAAHASQPDAGPVARPFAPFLVLLSAIDHDHAMSFVTAADLKAWGVDEDTVLAEARANLVDADVQLGVADDRSWLAVLGPDSYETSWLAAPDVLEDMGRSVLGGEFVILAPARDQLRLVSTADPRALQHKLEEALAEYQDAPRQLSPAPYKVVNGVVMPWEAPAGHPCEAIVERAHQVLAAVEYHYQSTALNDLFEKTGDDVFVANYNLVERPDGSVWSWSAWVKQVTDGLVPRTDYLALGDNDNEEIFWVRWRDAERYAADALRPERGYYPPRWRVNGWPDGRVVARLRSLAVEPAA